MNNRIESKKNRFLKLTPENGDFNNIGSAKKRLNFLLTK
jgi:hypothetical protein